MVQAAGDLCGESVEVEFKDEMTYRFNAVYERKVTFFQGEENAVVTKLSDPVVRNNNNKEKAQAR